MPIQIPIVSGPSVEAKFVPKEGQDVKALPSAFGVSSADDMGTGLMSMSKSMAEHEENQANLLATDATNKLNQFQLDTLYNKDNGFFTKQGKSALGQEQNLSDAWDQQVNSIADSIPNKMAQAKFKIIGDKAKIGYMEGIYNHANTQAINYQKDVMANGIEVNSQLAFANRNNPLVVDKYIGNIRGIIAANNPDKTPEAIKLAEDDAISKMHINNIGGMLADHNLQAEAYYEKYKNQIAPDAQASLMKSIKESDADIRARLTADSLFNSGVSEDEAFKKAHSIKDLDLRDATESKLSYLYGRKRELKNQAEDDYAKNTWEALIKNPDINLIPSNMPADKKISMIEFCKRGGVNGVTTDLDTWGELTRLSTENPAEFKKLDLTQFSGSVSQNDLHVLAKKQQLVGTPEYSVIMANDGYVKNAANALGFTKNKKNKWDSRREELAGDAQALIHDIEVSKGRALKPYEKASIINAMSYKSKGKGITPKDTSTFDVMRKGTSSLSQDSYLKSVSDAISYFQEKNNRMPNQKELYDITYHYANLAIQSHNQNVYNSKKGSYFEGHQITSPFGYREKPRAGASTYHKGVDLSFKMNEPIKSFTSGTVINTGHSQTLGNFVMVKGNDGAVYEYGHANSVNVKKGAKVSPSTTIAFAGSTGVSTGPHLHFAKMVNGKYVDPVGSFNNSTIIAHNSNTVRMKAPNGHIYNVPIAQVAEYQKIGGVKI